MTIAYGEEVATYIDFDQFIKNRSVDTCGFAATLLNHFAAEKGKPYGATPEILAMMQDMWYSKFDGPDIPSNHNGMTNDELFKLIVDIGNHYQNLYPLGGVQQNELVKEIAYWIGDGFPVIMAVAESSVLDVGLGKCPYAWDTVGLSHIITVTGCLQNGNFLVRDTANVGRPGPREYVANRLDIYQATVFVPKWLPRPYSAFELYPPTQKLPVVTPPVEKALTLQDILTSLESLDSSVQAFITNVKQRAKSLNTPL